MLNTADTLCPKLPAFLECKAQLSIDGLGATLQNSFPINTENESEILKARFWRKVNKRATCWEWDGAHQERGYGKFRIGQKQYYAHRVSAWLAGMIPTPAAPSRFDQHIKGFVLHHCDNPKCVKPEHLWIGNTSDNQKDCYLKGRHKTPSNYEYYHSNKQNLELF